MRTLLVMLLFITPATAFACVTFSDCEIGSKCVKRDGSLYGICRGGRSPGNAHDKHPFYAPMDPNGTYGDTCTFNSDCGINSKCVKRRAASIGTCVKR